ncbi:ABC transporter substrate-binding protein [Ornithinimicrobium pekingense]|uniref:Thiamine pyrimidine synthase n=1 Tax=Ornithinimicrobium pekingense TaxID=384677 RepID=A0ABQ2FB60_9MICO|nr:ABC transporter substrate-binding protein [Ornithinimicrobium pekingense]GGK79707.1 ABC transporter substrate-binding protein [Ornithinimicrobium pekingense]
MKKWIAAPTTLTLAALLAACSGPAAEEAEQQDGAEGSAAAGGLTELSVAAVSTSCLQFFPLYVAQEQGLFEENGLDVQVERMNGSAAVLQAMLAGQTDLGTPGPVPTILTQAQGEDIRYIANLWPGGAFALVTPEESGVADASELTGKTIGVATADGSEVSFAHTIMAAEGLEESDYEILTVGEGGQAVAAFQRGDIDAYAASIDGVAIIEHAGIPLSNITGDATGYLFGNGLAAPAELIESDPESLEAFGNAYRQGLEMAIDDRQLVTDACAAVQPQEVEDPTYVEAHLDALIPSLERTDGEPWGSMSQEHWEMILQDAVDMGEVEEGEVEVDNLYTNDLVDGFNS